MGWLEALKLARKFWYVFPLIGMAVALVWLRGSLISAEGDAKAAEARVSELNQANETLSKTIDMVTRQRVDNDAIAEAVAARVSDNRSREAATHTIIERTVQNDPEARDWANVPVPSGVREGLRAGKVDPVAP